MPRPSGSSETLKNEEIDGTRYRDHRDAADHIGAFVDQVYKRQRLHSALGYQTPVAFEAEHHAQTRAIRPLMRKIYGDARCPTHAVNNDAGERLRERGPRRFVVDAVDVDLNDAFTQRRGIDALAMWNSAFSLVYDGVAAAPR